jgi:hypothetical protein
VSRAAGICLRDCAVLEECRQWAATQKHLSGVVGGVKYVHGAPKTSGRKAGRPKKKAS